MRLGFKGNSDPTVLAFARQLGATDFICTFREFDSETGYYNFHDLCQTKARIENAGLKWTILEGVPAEWCNKIKLGLPGRDEQIENWCRTLRSMGAAGIPGLGYPFSLRCVGGNYGLRTSNSDLGRAGAVVTSFDYEKIKGARQDYWDPPVSDSLELSDEDMWDNFSYFLEAVMPVAEEVGVRMGLHPDDPPISPIGGISRIFRTHDALKRATEIVPSDYNCLGFCQGTISEMPGNVLDAIQYFGSRNKILYVHYRFVSGTVPRFSETFIDEGNVDPMESMRAYQKVGFDGAMIEDHVPELAIDHESEKYTSRAYALGYMKALLDNVNGDAQTG